LFYLDSVFLSKALFLAPHWMFLFCPEILDRQDFRTAF